MCKFSCMHETKWDSVHGCSFMRLTCNLIYKPAGLYVQCTLASLLSVIKKTYFFFTFFTALNYAINSEDLGHCLLWMPDLVFIIIFFIVFDVL